MKKTLQAFYTLEDLKHFPKSQIRRSFGGKALGLFEAHLLQISVPETYLFPIEHYEEFLLAKGNLSFKEEAVNWLQKHFKKELSFFSEKLWAVRSSSQYEDAFDHSFAGIFESKLNVSPHEIASAIAEVWESSFSLRVKTYVKSDKDLRMGVIVQPMVLAKYSGILFSKNPSPSNVYENQNVIIEFAPMGGEKIVQGEITPFRLSGTIESILSSTDNLWVGPLLKAMLALRNSYGHEMDIEFVVDQTEKFWLVQQRPISVMHASRTLDLSFYQRKFKRALLTLDSELFIDGCAQYLAAYLEIPYQMERWMVVVSKENLQELWAHALLDQAIISKMGQRILEDKGYLVRVEERYQHYHHMIFNHPYSQFFDSASSLAKRFFSFCEFILPLEAHYYVPIFMIEALHALLKKEFHQIDLKNGEKDLFKMGTFKTATLMEILFEELREVKARFKQLPKEFSLLEKEAQKKLDSLSKLYGFLKCRSLDEPGYTKEDLFELLQTLPEKEGEADPKEYELLREKYLKNEKVSFLFEEFRKWLRIRNQEMEFLYFAFLKARPLFLEISETFSLPLKTIWKASRESILLSLNHGDSSYIEKFSTENLVILRSYGKMRLNTQLHVLEPKKEEEGILRGKTVFGSGKIEARVKIAFSTKEIEDFSARGEKRVLVTSMTTPDFIPYLQKEFSALITDEGGILCHAAIVAREIPIPCIVGTAIATEILKESEKVLLDFDLGEIRKIT